MVNFSIASSSDCCITFFFCLFKFHLLCLYLASFWFASAVCLYDPHRERSWVKSCTAVRNCGSSAISLDANSSLKKLEFSRESIGSMFMKASSGVCSGMRQGGTINSCLGDRLDWMNFSRKVGCCVLFSDDGADGGSGGGGGADITWVGMGFCPVGMVVVVLWHLQFVWLCE